MSYSNSLTTGIQTYIRTTLAQKITASTTVRRIGRTAREIRAYLSDPSTLSTPDFVIRRYLQACHPGLLDDYGPLPDLVAGQKNLPWPQQVIESLASRLAALSKEQQAAISASQWRNYLTGSSARKREQVLAMAFTLKMDSDQTLDLLLAFGMEPFSVRYPLDLICMFCLKDPGTYTWAQAQDMLREFLARRTSQACGTTAATAGMTEQIEADLDELFGQHLQGSNARDALIRYMVDHSGEFISFRDGKKEVFLPGYTLGRTAQYHRLTEYLAVLYPHTITAIPGKDGQGSDRQWDPKLWHNRTEYVDGGSAGEISLSALTRAMFWSAGWTEIWWDGEIEPGSFQDNMRKFCENYEQHIGKVSRLFRGGSTIAYFDRRDALLFIFFFISGCGKLLTDPDYDAEHRLSRLRDMTCSGDSFDRTLGSVLKKLEELYGEFATEDAALRFRILCRCFNMILAPMDHANLYLPAQFDRFVLLALLAEDPEELAGVVMSESVWEEYAMPYTSPLAGKK